MGSQSSMLSQSTTIRLGLLLLASLALVASAAPSAHLDQQWEQFKTRYAKAYPRALENRRRMAWEANYQFVSMMNGLHYSETSDGQQNNVFNPILEKLPEKVDCSMKWGNHGCFGGLMDFAFKYIRDNKGIDTEESYPYTAKTGKECLFNDKPIGAVLSSWTDIKKGSEEELAHAVATVGPISVGIDAAHPGFQMYKKGVYHEKHCNSTMLDHGVLVVGYGSGKNTSGKKENYWIVKNSWGTTWGDKGYIKMARDAKNMCGIATAASFPVV